MPNPSNLNHNINVDRDDKKLPTREQVNLSNWDEAPYNRWVFYNIPYLLPCISIARSRQPSQLKRAKSMLSLEAIHFEGPAGKPANVAAMLEDTQTNAFLVIKDNKLVDKQCFKAMRPESTHILMFGSKSYVTTIAAMLSGLSVVDLLAAITDYVSELTTIGVHDTTVQMALDMMAGETVNHHDREEMLLALVGYRQPPPNWTPFTDLSTLLRGFSASTPDKVPTFNYCSIWAKFVAIAVERASGKTLAELLQLLIWEPLGCEYDAAISYSTLFGANAEGGICVTAWDWLRFGQLMFNDGRTGGNALLSKVWVKPRYQGTKIRNRQCPVFSLLGVNHQIKAGSYEKTK